MNTNEKHLLNAKLKKYAAYISNLSWHLQNNNPQGKEREVIEQRIKDFGEAYNDLKDFL